jgi:hypothetical protein
MDQVKSGRFNVEVTKPLSKQCAPGPHTVHGRLAAEAREFEDGPLTQWRCIVATPYAVASSPIPLDKRTVRKCTVVRGIGDARRRPSDELLGVRHVAILGVQAANGTE